MQIQNMLQDHGKHGHQFQNTNTKYVLGSWTTISKYKFKLCSRILVNMGSKYKAGVPELGLPAIDPLVVRRKSFFLSSNEKMSWFFRCLRLSWTWGTARWSLRTLLQTGWAGLSCLPSITLVFFVGFRFIALLKDCVLTSWQVYCQVGQLWQSKQLNQVEHGLWQYGVNRWSVKFSISKLVTILAAIFLSGKYTVTVLGTSSGPYNNSYSTIEVQIFCLLFRISYNSEFKQCRLYKLISGNIRDIPRYWKLGWECSQAGAEGQHCRGGQHRHEDCCWANQVGCAEM